jgi:aminoglycoside phosphotransferase (APT) family kinase protein
MAARNMPAAEIDVTADLVRRLLTEQHPDLAELPLEFVANGWDNVIVRIGGGLVARMPRRQMAAELVVNEQRWLPEFAERLPIAIPVPVRVGTPGDAYPWNWSICPWFEGDVAADVSLVDARAQATRLGEFVGALHCDAPPDAPHNEFRGQPLSEVRPRIAANIERLGSGGSIASVIARFDEAAEVEEWTGSPQWLHGDLHSANVLVTNGAISAVIDFGDVTSGDPSVDLAIAWMLFDVDDRAEFRRAVGDVDDATWSRATAWALHFAVMYLLHSADSNRFDRMGSSLLARVLGEP